MKGRPRLALVLAAVGARLSSAGDAVAPGDVGYYTLLQDVHTTCPSAHFDPSFKPDVLERSVTVSDVHTTSITFWITLDKEMYTEGGYPYVFIDGHKLDYDPLQDLNYTYMLNETIDAVEKALKIKVEDPYEREVGLHFTSNPATEYTFLILQAPEWDLVVQAQSIRVTDSHGKETQADKPGKFDSKSDNSVYFYKLAETSCKKDCTFYVEARCSDVVTKVNVDGQERENGEKVGFDMRTFAEKVVTIECIYDNEKWTQGDTQQRYYSVVLQRDVEFQGHLMVSMLPHEGVCDALPESKSFDCRSDVEEPKLIVHATLTHMGEQIFVQAEGDDHMAEVRSGLPIQLQGIGDVQVILEQGRDRTNYPVYIHNPAKCSDSSTGMTCPKGMAFKEPSHLVKDHVCKSEKCDASVDLPFCCDDRVTCEHFDDDWCPEGFMVSESTSKELCKMTVCHEDDHTVCCDLKQTCKDFDWELCAEDSYVRTDAAKVPCESMVCSDIDIPLCCVGVSQQTCAWFDPSYCPDGYVVETVDAYKSYCAGEECSESDASTCCVQKAKCSTYKCPHNLTKQDGAENIDCRSDVCNAHDMGTCCVVGAKCDTMKCHPHHVPNSHAADLWCKSDPCGDDDEETCCVSPGSCDDFRGSCPDGKSLVYRAEEVLCRQAKCNHDDDKDNCCVYRESCANFPGECPEGSELWDGGVCEHETCTTSKTDKTLCCQPSLGQMQEGIVMIENCGYDKLVETHNQGEVEELVAAAIAKHVNFSVDYVEVVVGRSMEGETSCNFLVDTADLDAKGHAALKDKFKNKASLMSFIDRKIGNLECKIDPSETIKVGFILAADAMVDGAHGGVYIRGKTLVFDGDTWAIMLPGGHVEEGFSEVNLRNIDDKADFIEEDVYVDALTLLVTVSQLIESGLIDPDLKDWVRIPDLNRTELEKLRGKYRDSRTHSGGGGPNAVVVVLIVLGVLVFAALLGGAVYYLLFLRSKRPADEAGEPLTPTDEAS